MTLFGEEWIRERIVRWAGEKRCPAAIRVVTDTSDFLGVDYGDILVLEDRPYLVGHCEREGRFGMDDQPKYWVRRVLDLVTGELRLAKMEFHERYRARVGPVSMDFVRSPEKESRILALVAGHPHFMQGRTVRDVTGNNVRIIEYIRGATLTVRLDAVTKDHETYVFSELPGVLDQFIELVRAVAFLHDHGEKHGDIRRDHAIFDDATDRYRWIDFDYNVWHPEGAFGYDLFGLGNVLCFIVGRGDVLVRDLREGSPRGFEALRDGDLNVIFGNRVMNLGRIYPYIPRGLGTVLGHFSRGARVFYDDVHHLLEDLCEARGDLDGPAPVGRQPGE